MPYNKYISTLIITIKNIFEEIFVFRGRGCMRFRKSLKFHRPTLECVRAEA